jgi:glycerophosphoryl diester phosphodiesterase
MTQAGSTSAARPLVLGHRGASAEAPENTLAAFRLALAQGADGVELDVWRCGSGEVVVFHDQDARRTAGAPLRIAEAPLEALRELDAGAWKGERFRGERIPQLAEVLEALPGARVNVELKGPGGDGRVAAAAAEVIRRAGAGERVLVSSFQARLLAAFRAAAPEVARGFLFEGGWSWRPRVAAARAWLRPAALHPEARLVTAARAARWSRMGLAVNVWTVDEEGEVERLAAMWVAGIITNVPGRVVARLRGPGVDGGSWSSNGGNAQLGPGPGSGPGAR